MQKEEGIAGMKLVCEGEAGSIGDEEAEEEEE